MKRLIAGIAAAFMMAAGLVYASGTTATAGPYAGTVATTTNAFTRGPVNRLQRPTVRIAVRAQGGNAEPRGPMQITFVRRDGTNQRRYSRFYDGSPSDYSFPALRRPGRYIVTVTFQSYQNSVYASSSTSTRQFVRNRPRR